MVKVYVLEHLEEFRFDIRFRAGHHGGGYRADLDAAVGIEYLIGTEETVAFADAGYAAVGQKRKFVSVGSVDRFAVELHQVPYDALYGPRGCLPAFTAFLAASCQKHSGQEGDCRDDHCSLHNVVF